MTTSDSSPSETPIYAQPKGDEGFSDANELTPPLSYADAVAIGRRVSLTGNDIGFILSGEFGPRTCPCSHCIALAQKLQSMLGQSSRIPPEEQQ